MLGANGSRISFLSPVAPNARLRPRLQRQHAPPPENRPPERFEVPMIEPPPDIAREAIELPPVHALNEATPALDHDRRRG